MAREFSAQYAFTCGCCGERQAEGTIAQFGPDGVLRNVEADHTPGDYGSESHAQPSGEQPRTIEVMPRGKTAADRCERCFQIPSSNGQCGCF